MLKYSTLAIVIALFFSCNSNKKENTNTINEPIMDSIIAEAKTSSLIRGEEGFIHVDDGGEGGIPVLFVHSFAGSTVHWKKQLDHLRKTRRAVAFDFRGHGQSEVPNEKDVFKIEQLADDISAVADSLHLDRFILVGHSMGGATAIEYAAKHPERVAGLVIAGVPPKIPKEQSEPIMKSLRSDAYQKVMDDYVNVQLMGAKPATNALLKPAYQKIDKETTINSVSALFSGDPGTALKKYNGPKLILSSVAEEKQPITLHKQEPAIPFKTIDNSSHWVMLDQPDEFTRILDEFINSIDQQ